MSSSLIARYRREIEALKGERMMREMSDDFAYSNGSLREIDRQISHLRDLIKEAELAHSEAA